MADKQPQAALAPERSAPASAVPSGKGSVSLEDMVADDLDDDGDEGEPAEDALDETDAPSAEDSDEPSAEDDDSEPSEDDDDSEAPAEEETPNDEPADAAKGLEKLAKSEFAWAAKRIAKQAADIRKLRDRDTVQLTPTADYPLAGLDTEQALTAAISAARAAQKRLSALRDEDFTEGRDGQLVTEVKENGKRVLMTKDEVAEALVAAEAKLEDKAIEQRKQYIAYRQQNRPREQAEALVPGILQPGTPANKLLTHIQEMCPALRAVLPDYEVFIAHVYRSYQQHVDTQPSKDFPKGRKKIVIYDLDKDGKVIPPKRTEPSPKAGSKPNPSLPRAPAASRAPSKSTATTKRDAAWGRAKAGYVDLEELVDEAA